MTEFINKWKKRDKSVHEELTQCLCPQWAENNPIPWLLCMVTPFWKAQYWERPDKYVLTRWLKETSAVIKHVNCLYIWYDVMKLVFYEPGLKLAYGMWRLNLLCHGASSQDSFTKIYFNLCTIKSDTPAFLCSTAIYTYFYISGWCQNRSQSLQRLHMVNWSI